jgi:hypothetical protein
MKSTDKELVGHPKIAGKLRQKKKIFTKHPQLSMLYEFFCKIETFKLHPQHMYA